MTNLQTPLYILLASMSRYRAECLQKLEVTFDQWAPHIDETQNPGESPTSLVKRLAQNKAQAAQYKVLEKPYTHIIASDQVMTFDDRILGKPHTPENARTQLQTMSGKRATFLTSLCIYDVKTGHSQISVDTTNVAFRVLSESVIDRYLKIDEPFDCAGSFKSERAGIALVHSIEGKDPNALIGLPMIDLVDGIIKTGYELP